MTPIKPIHYKTFLNPAWVNWVHFESNFVHSLRRLWPKQRSVIGRTVYPSTGANTIQAGDLYRALKVKDFDDV